MRFDLPKPETLNVAINWLLAGRVWWASDCAPMTAPRISVRMHQHADYCHRIHSVQYQYHCISVSWQLKWVCVQWRYAMPAISKGRENHRYQIFSQVTWFVFTSDHIWMLHPTRTWPWRYMKLLQASILQDIKPSHQKKSTYFPWNTGCLIGILAMCLLWSPHNWIVSHPLILSNIS